MELTRAELAQPDPHHSHVNTAPLPYPHGLASHQDCQGCYTEGTQKTLDIIRVVLGRETSLTDEVKEQVWEIITKPFVTERKIWTKQRVHNG